jgi:hypothetical protein
MPCDQLQQQVDFLNTEIQELRAEQNAELPDSPAARLIGARIAALLHSRDVKNSELQHCLHANDHGLHICVVTESGGLWHAIRQPVGTGNWTLLGDVKAVVNQGLPRGDNRFVSATLAPQDTGILLYGAFHNFQRGPLSPIGNFLSRTRRHIDGTWEPFHNLGGSFDVVDCAACAGHVHVCGIEHYNNSSNNQGGLLFHTIDGMQPGYGNVNAVVLGQNPGSPDPGVFADVSCAAIGADLHVSATANGNLWHLIRRADGSWTPFGDVRGVALVQNPGTPNPGLFQKVSCTELNGELHVCTSANDTLWHTIRRADTSWYPFGNVTAVVLGQNPNSPNPGTITAVSCSTLAGELHVCASSGSILWHTIRRADGSWTAFENVYASSGTPDLGQIVSVRSSPF